MDIESAQKSGAMMLFGEKYGDTVRVLDIGSSRELCGGTHVQRTGDIGVFKIYSESGVAAGVRRVEATTGPAALAMLNNQLGELAHVAQALRVAAGGGAVQGAVEALLAEKKALEKEVAALKGKLASSQGDELVNRLVDRILLRRKARKTAAPEASLDEDRTFFGAQEGDYAERIERTAEEQREQSEREAHEHPVDDGGAAEGESRG